MFQQRDLLRRLEVREAGQSSPMTSFSIFACIVGIVSSCARSVQISSCSAPTSRAAPSWAPRARSGTCACRRSSPPGDTYLLVLISFSIGCGAMFLPPAVTMMSFLRSVMRRKPSSSAPMSPVWNQPSASIASARRVRVVVVALHDVRAAREDLAVGGDPDLDARHRLAHRADAEVRPACSRRSPATSRSGRSPRGSPARPHRRTC